MRVENVPEKTTLETSGEDVKTTLETSGEDLKTTLETSAEDLKITLETSGEDIRSPVHVCFTFECFFAKTTLKRPLLRVHSLMPDQMVMLEKLSTTL